MLSVVATPIGNLGDVTLRALETLRVCEKILCEDTRRTRKLLERHQIQKPLVSYHEHTGEEAKERILAELQSGAHLALVSDGGMPLVSDPGFDLLRRVRAEKLDYEILPGPSAVLTALVTSGLAVDEFSFFGFLPPKTVGRKKKLTELMSRTETLIFFESPFRIAKTLKDAGQVLGDREAAVARELTKKFEEVHRGFLSELAERFEAKSYKGEMVLVIAGAGRKRMWSEEQ